MNYIIKLASICILVSIFVFGINHNIFAQKSSFEETFKVLESSLIDYFETQLSFEIDTISSNGKTALFAELQLVKTKTEMIKTDLRNGDIYSSLDSTNTSALVSIVYCMLVFKELDFIFVERFLNKMISNEMLDQGEKICILGALKEYKVDKMRIKDFSQKENTNEFQLYLSTILGFFKGCIS